MKLKYPIQPSKKLGQNFLTDRGAVKKVIQAADLNSEDLVLEIGPGTGILTRELAKKSKKVLAVEKDQKMIAILKESLSSFQNVEIVKDDILKWPLPDKKYKVVANLPFYLTAPVVRKLLESPYPPEEMVLVVQKEVGQRICAKPPRMSILAVSVQFYAEVKVISYISKKSFWPSPKVDSAIIKIKPILPNPSDRLFFVNIENRDLFFKIIKAGFSQPRKQLANNLSKKLKIEKKQAEEWLLNNNIQPSQRAETLSVENWVNLTKTYL